MRTGRVPLSPYQLAHMFQSVYFCGAYVHMDNLKSLINSEWTKNGLKASLNVCTPTLSSLVSLLECPVKKHFGGSVAMSSVTEYFH